MPDPEAREARLDDPRVRVLQQPRNMGKGAAGGRRVWEVGISYSGRTYDEGKKIGWRDGASAVRCIVKYVLSVRRGRSDQR